ncbi:hypothetical protein ACTHQT_04040 [Cytobacillus praedii]
MHEKQADPFLTPYKLTLFPLDHLYQKVEWTKRDQFIIQQDMKI